MDKYTIVLCNNSKKYKVTKIAFYSDGGFCIFAPCNSVKKGILAKLTINYSKTEDNVTKDYITEYTADDQVKLSLHPDGFVQFSGIHPNIYSGKDSETGEPKGLGIFTSPLNKVIKSGPTFGISVWGVNEFEELTTVKKKDKLVEFEEADYYYRHCTSDDWNGYIIEGFLFEPSYVKYVKNINGKAYLVLQHFNYEIAGTVFRHRVIEQYNNDYFITLLISRTKFLFKSKSGFSLNSPGEIVDKSKNIGSVLTAVYPPDLDLDLPSKSLNYTPESVKFKNMS